MRLRARVGGADLVRSSKEEIHVPDQGQEGHPDGGEDTTSGDTTYSVKLGLVAAPEVPEKVAREFASELPGLLGRQVDGRVSWRVSVAVDPLTGAERKAPEILDACRDRRLEEGWDLAVCLTDLPVYRGGRLVVADASAGRGAALVSMPVLGVTRLRPRTREATLQLVEELYTRIPELGKDTALPGTDESGTDVAADAAEDRRAGHRPRQLVARRLVELVAPFRRVEPPDEDMKDMDVDARFAAPGVPGRLRLLSGMVLANRPWKLFPSFKGTLAAAFATGAYALVITTLWLLSDSVGFWRLVLLMVTAIVAMVVWIIVAHHLWERPRVREERKWAALYNGVTVLTISVAVLLAYAVLFALIFVAAWVFVPGAYFQTILKHPVGFGEYLTLSWLAASLATVAGALGSSLEDEDTVREATYGYRQRRRNESQDHFEDDAR
jgi:hypothetical protein